MAYDIIVVGGGMVGLTFAAAISQQTSLSIAILEAQKESHSWIEDQYHHRVSAIALSSQRIFQALHVWNDIKHKRVSPFSKIQVWDTAGKSNIEFNSNDIAEPWLGWIIENSAIQTSLEEKIKKNPRIEWVSSIKLSAFQEDENGVALTSENGQIFKAKLVIAADGAQSWLRQAAGIEVNVHDYEQEAIVATVATALPHQQTARQCFRDTGPLAFLPLLDMNTSSIVWTLPVDEAVRLMQLDDKGFCDALANTFDQCLGEVLTIGKRYTFPLRKQHAECYVKSRVVLIGDAAHTIHPLAGQGVNMGLLDAASLSEMIAEAVQCGRDFASAATLRRYERWRKADNLTMLAGVDAIKNLFASDKTSVQTIRSAGVAFTNQFSWLKNIFIRHAVGNRNGLPKMAR